MKKIIAAAAVILIGGLIFLGVKIFSRDNLEFAIAEFEGADYIGSIIILNRLSATAKYDELEKIYYYKCRAINSLADEIEGDYSSELTDAAAENKNSEAFERYRKKIEIKLAKINEKINGDLALVITRKKSRVISKGKFYDEFTGRFKGSPYIEDLDFEELQKILKTEPDRIAASIVSFYGRYPNSPYLSQIVKMIMDSMKSGASSFSDRGDAVLKMITSYAKKYPTSPDISKILVCSGDDVNLRNSPGTEGKLVGKVARDTILIQLEKSMDTAQIGDVRDYWYRVSTIGGQSGWIFGKFIQQADPAKYESDSDGDEVWTVTEIFDEWSDSNTPKNWSHADDAGKTSIGFTAHGARKIALLDSPKGTRGGLFTRFSSTRAFTVSARGRFIKGDGAYLFAYAIDGGKSFYVRLSPESINASGRIIPLDTTGWHVYTLTSRDGRHADLLIDGDLISGKIEPVNSPLFMTRGVYALYSSAEDESRLEAEYIKIK